MKSTFKLNEQTKKTLVEYSVLLNTSMTDIIEQAVLQFNPALGAQDISTAIQKANELPKHIELIAVFNNNAIGINEGIIEFLKKGTPIFKRDSAGSLNLHLIK
jgi:hypothetical protein